jgi:branched-chain amino acid transport system substrate-binding protein
MRNLSNRTASPSGRRLVMLATLAGLLLAGCSREADKPATGAGSAGAVDLVARIGVAAQFTGPQAHLGEDIRNGTQLAVDDLNAQGVMINGQRLRLELVPGDDEGDPTKATTVAQSLVDAKVVGVVGHFNSGSSIPASKIYADAGIPQISPGSTNPKYTQQGFATTFRVVANDDQQGPALARFAATVLKVKTVSVIDDATAYGQGLADTFTRAAEAAGIKVLGREHTTDKDTDFKAILTAIKGRKPEAIMFGGIDPQAGPMVKQMRQLGIKARFLGGDGIQTANFLQLAGNQDAEGVHASMPGLPKAQMPGGQAFFDRFKARFGKEVELFAPMGYDAVQVLVDAMKRAGSIEPARYLPEVGKTRLDGVIGPIAFDDKGDLKDGPITVYVVRAGQWQAEQTFGGATAPAEAPAAAAGAPAPAQAR